MAVVCRLMLPVAALAGLGRAEQGTAACAGRADDESCGAAQPISQDSVLLQSKYSMEERRPKSKAPQEIPREDWMMELTLDNEWIAGGGKDDVQVMQLGSEDKKAFVSAAHVQAKAINAEGGDAAVHSSKAWRKKFAHEHRRAVKTMTADPSLVTFSGHPCKRHPGAGAISGLYTFGAPGTALAPLQDPLAPDGKFAGLRCVTQMKRSTWRRVERTYSDPVTFFAGIVGLKHPHMDTLRLPVGYSPELMSASAEVSIFPRSDMAFWVRGHFQDIYTEQITPVKDEHDIKLYEMLYLSRAVDPNTVKPISTANTAIEAQHVGWNVVATSKNVKLSMVDTTFLDNVTLFQDPRTQACALSFVPTHKVAHWLVNLRFLPRTFCGMPNIHKGFRDQVRRVIRSPGWAARVQPAMQACSEMYLTGHSLGAGQAQLVAACLQRAPAEGEDGWEDYKHMVWTPSADTIESLPALGMA